MPEKESPIKGIFHSLGLVFGDIGTSPIYTLTVIFLLPAMVRTEESIIGVLSLIVWTLIILVTLQYAWLATSLSKRGEGGTIVLRELLIPLLKSGRSAAFFTLVHRHLASRGRRRNYSGHQYPFRGGRHAPHKGS
jgi:KUP system potassium uptake protein